MQSNLLYSPRKYTHVRSGGTYGADPLGRLVLVTVSLTASFKIFKFWQI